MTSQQFRMAYHEAGHAVVAFRLGIRIKHATIIPEAEAGSLGAVTLKTPRWFDPDITDDPRSERWAFRHIMMALAGEEAERLLTGRDNPEGAAQDRESVVGLALCVIGSAEEAEALLAWLQIRTRLLVHSPLRRAAIAAVAQALMRRKTLTGRQVQEISAAAIQAAVKQRYETASTCSTRPREQEQDHSA